MSWTLPKNATAVRTLLGAFRDSEPTVYYDNRLTQKSMPNIEDGTWYFHVNYFANGAWSKTQHFRIQIDTTNPTDLSVRSKKDDTGKVTLSLKAGDSLSGIDNFKVVVGSDNPLTVKADAQGEASLEVPFYRPGKHDVTVSAFDKVGNKADTKITIQIDAVPELRIESYPARIKVNESIEISGTAPLSSSATPGFSERRCGCHSDLQIKI